MEEFHRLVSLRHMKVAAETTGLPAMTASYLGTCSDVFEGCVLRDAPPPPPRPPT